MKKQMITLRAPIYEAKNPQRVWLPAGAYKLVRELDSDRLVIKAGRRIAVIRKALTNYSS